MAENKDKEVKDIEVKTEEVKEETKEAENVETADVKPEEKVTETVVEEPKDTTITPKTEVVVEDKKPKNTLAIVLGIIAVVLGAGLIYMLMQPKINKDTVETDDKALVDMLVTEDGKRKDDRSFNDVLVSISNDSFSEKIIKTLTGMKIGETKSVTVKETVLKDGVQSTDIPEEAYQDGTASKYYEEKDVKYTFKVKTIWKKTSDITKDDSKDDSTTSTDTSSKTKDKKSK